MEYYELALRKQVATWSHGIILARASILQLNIALMNCANANYYALTVFFGGESY